MKFTKMQGAGNDYVYIDCVTQPDIEDPSALAVRLSERHYGIGSDGIILIRRSDIADFRMSMFNADGSEAKMCGNGIRCFSRLCRELGLTDKEEISVETLSGIKYIRLLYDNGRFNGARVNMGVPCFETGRIPCVWDAETMIGGTITVGGKDYTATCVSMGNPHCVVFTDADVYDIPLEEVGPLFERHAMFPERVNTEFVNVLPDGSLKMRVWERGSGETWACGTGACGVFAAAKANGIVSGDSAAVHLRGGDLFIEWAGGNEPLYMTGDAVIVYTGEIDI